MKAIWVTPTDWMAATPVRIRARDTDWRDQVWVGRTGSKDIAWVHVPAGRVEVGGDGHADAVTRLWDAVNA